MLGSQVPEPGSGQHARSSAGKVHDGRREGDVAGARICSACLFPLEGHAEAHKTNTRSRRALTSEDIKAVYNFWERRFLGRAPCKLFRELQGHSFPTSSPYWGGVDDPSS